MQKIHTPEHYVIFVISWYMQHIHKPEHYVILVISGYMQHIHKPEHYVILLHVPERHSFIAGRKYLDTIALHINNNYFSYYYILTNILHIYADPEGWGWGQGVLKFCRFTLELAILPPLPPSKVLAPLGSLENYSFSF